MKVKIKITKELLKPWVDAEFKNVFPVTGPVQDIFINQVVVVTEAEQIIVSLWDKESATGLITNFIAMGNDYRKGMSNLHHFIAEPFDFVIDIPQEFEPLVIESKADIVE